MYRQDQWQFWAIGAGLLISAVASSQMNSIVPLASYCVIVVVVGALDERRRQRRFRERVARQQRDDESTCPAPAAEGSDSKVCPRCAETVKAAALVCRYCGHEFGDAVTGSPPSA